VRAQAGFHADDARWQLLEGVFEAQPSGLLTEGDLLIGTEPDAVKHLLTDVNADDGW
jgi:hypothetical protein